MINPLKPIWLQFYNEMKVISNKSNLAKWDRIKLTMIDTVILYTLIYIVLIIIYFDPHDPVHQQWRVGKLLIYQGYDPNILVCAFLLFGFTLFCRLFLYRKIDAINQPSLEILLINTDQILDRSRTLFSDLINPKLISPSVFKYFGKLIRLFRTLWNVTEMQDLIQFDKSLKHFPYTRNQTRIRLFLILMSCELLFTFGFIVYVVISMVELFHYWKILSDLGLNRAEIVATVADISLMVSFVGWFTFKVCFFVVISGVGPIYFVSRQYQQLNRELAELTEKYCRNGGHSIPRIASKLGHFLREHNRLTHYIFITNSVWSLLILVFLLTNIPLNVYLSSFFYFRYGKVDPIANMVIIWVLVIQIVGTGIAVIPLAIIPKTLHDSGRYMIPLQAAISKSGYHYYRLQLKWMACNEIINSNTIIGFQTGSFTTITYRAIFEFIFVYYGYLMYATRLIKPT